MATIRFMANPGNGVDMITEAVGSATASKCVEVTIDTAATIVNANGTTRALTRGEVLQCLENIMQALHRGSWPR